MKFLTGVCETVVDNFGFLLLCSPVVYATGSVIIMHAPALVTLATTATLIMIPVWGWVQITKNLR
jgi:hypothetical protein